MPPRFPLAGFFLALLLVSPTPAFPSAAAWTSHSWDHLRSGTGAEWETFARSRPSGSARSFTFVITTNAPRWSLFWAQEDVKLSWGLELNGKRVGSLTPVEFPSGENLDLPEGLVRVGTNHLRIIPPTANDDIRLGQFELHPRPRREVLSEAQLMVEVRDRDTGELIPARVTVVDARGAWVPLSSVGEPQLALRSGVAYSGQGTARLGLRAGEIRVLAGRGPDYSLDQRQIQLRAGDQQSVVLKIRREVARPGWVSSDPHIHTLTFSGHGDATLAERLITLAGEDLDFPISTEHNRHVDFSVAAAAAGLDRYFFPITGNEVTTRRGHFNIFPVSSNQPPPRVDDLEQLPSLVAALSRVRVTILNHPRDTHAGFVPWHPTNFNRASGVLRHPLPLPFNAVEVLNSGAMRSDPLEPIFDWMAMLNAGHRLTAVGASDSHDVSRFIVGQGRTYLRVDRTRSREEQAREVIESYGRGRAVVSLGLFPWIEVSGAGPGDLVTITGRTIRVRAGVRHPTWIRADRLELFANGQRVRKSGGTTEVSWTLPNPRKDVYLVLLATGPGVEEGHWALARPYQPSQPAWKSRVLGLTNPVWVDVDGDGKFSVVDPTRVAN